MFVVGGSGWPALDVRMATFLLETGRPAQDNWLPESWPRYSVLLETRMDLESSYDRFRSMVSRVEETLTSVEQDLYKVLLLYFFGKSWKTFCSTHFLCKQRFAEDAGILTRSLFDLVVTLLYIGKAPAERAVLYYEYGIVLKEQLHATLSREPEDPWRQRILAAKSPEVRMKDREEYERVRKNYPKQYRWSGLTTKAMAGEVGLGWHYDFVYYQLSEFAHTGPNGVSTYMDFDKGNGLSFKECTTEDMDRIWTTASIYFLIVLDRIDDVFKLGIGEEIKAMDRDLKTRKKAK